MTSKSKVADRVGAVSVRVSESGGRGENKDKEFASPESQIEEGRAYLESMGVKCDLDLSRDCMDLDHSARKRGSWLKRPGINRLLDAARAGQITDIVFFKLARMARNVRDGLEIVDAFDDAGCTVHFVKDTMFNDPKSRKLLMPVMLSVASIQSDDISDHVTASHAHRRRKGIHSGLLPFWLERKEMQYLVKQDQYPKIRALVELGLQGKGYNTIASTLNRAGVMSPRGKTWSVGSVAQHLSPENLQKLLGHAFSHVGEESKTIGQIWPAVATDEEVGALSLIYGNRTAIYDSKATFSTNLCSGIMRCATCGMGMVRGGTNVRGVHIRGYRCPGAEARHPLHQGKHIFVVADNADNAMIRGLKYILSAAPPAALKDKTQIKGDKPLRTPKQIKDQMVDLVVKWTSNQINDEIYFVVRDGLEKELAQVEPLTVAPAAEVLNAALENLDEVSGWRQIAKTYISSARFPMLIEHEGKRQKAIEITSKYGETILVPILRSNYPGEPFIKTVGAEEVEEPLINQPDPKSL